MTPTEQYAFEQGKREAAKEIFYHLLDIETDETGRFIGASGMKGVLLDWIWKTYHPILDRPEERSGNTS